MVKRAMKKNEKIQHNLNKKLGPEYLSYRPGAYNSKLAYIEGWMIIKLANRIFGYDGWSSKIKKMKVDMQECQNDRWSVGVSCICRITLSDRTYREDVGYGCSENQKAQNVAFCKAKKEASTDALKRALRQFGEAMGNCCYDSIYRNLVLKVKNSEVPKISEDMLLRRSFHDTTEDLDVKELNSEDEIFFMSDILDDKE